MKRNFIIYFLGLFLIVSSNLYSQVPNWIASTPVISTTGPYDATLDYGIDISGTVYYIVYNANVTAGLPSTTVKSWAIAGPAGGRVATGILSISGGDINTVLQEVINLLPGITHSIYVVAEGSGGLQASPVQITFNTLPCPPIDVLTGFSQPVTCINLGATARFNVVTIDPDPAVTGIYSGTQWSLDWGDGTTATYTSVSDNDVPPLALRTHTYSTTTDCNYVFSSTIQNPCGETQSVQYIAVVHGRDIPADGDGQLEIVNDASGSTTIEVCAGTQTIITLRDNSIWNCQSPSLPGGLTPVPNDDPRNLEWIYGEDPTGGSQNTITGAVAIGGLGNAPQTSGRYSPAPNAPGELSETITIPSSCLPGETFRVYLKNWNKCNWGDPDYVSTYIDIEVVDVPASPTADDREICEGDDGTLTVSSVPIGTISWYSDAALTNFLGNGLSYTPTVTAIGTHNFYVTDREPTGNLCESYATTVTLTINERPGTVSIDGPKKNDICFGVEPPESYVITATPSAGPVVTGYQWYRDGNPIPGRNTDTLIISQVPESGLYTCAAIGAGPSFCLSDILPEDTLRVTVHTLLNVIQPVDQFICEDGVAAFTAKTTEDIANWQWEKSENGGLTYSTVGASAPYDGFNTDSLTLTAPGFAYDGFFFRVEMKTPNGQGGCAFKSDPAILTVYGLPSIDAGTDLPICTPTPLNPIPMTGAVLGGSASTVIWSGGGGLGTWTQDADPALATFTPVVPSGSFTATVTVTGMAECGSTVFSDTRVISWSETPQVEAGADITRCDATPLAPIIMIGSTATGSYSGLTWSGGAGLGTWVQNADPAFATFTPSTPSGSFTATLTVNGLGTCLGTNPSDTRVISWGETPVVDAGPDILKCDTLPFDPIPMTGSTATGTFINPTWTGGETMGTWTQNADPALATFTPSQNAGTFVATLTLAGDGACTGSDPADTRLIDWGFEAIVDAGPDQSICATASATLAGYISGGATIGTWSGGGGTFVPDNTTLNAVYTPSAAEQAAQTVTLTLTSDDPPGLCPIVSDQITISIGTLPQDALLTSSGDECFGAASSWINININGGASPYVVSYELNGTPQPDITTYFNATNEDLGILPIGTYTYEITAITDACGNPLPPAGLPAPVSFEIFENPVANAGSDKFDCGSLVTTVTAIPSVGTGIWTKASGPGTISFAPDEFSASATVTAGDYGSYVLRWTEVNGGICTDFSDIIVDLEKVAAAGASQELCATYSATMAGNVPAVGVGTWTHDSGPGTVSFSPNANAPDAVATVSAFGDYVFKWTISNSGLCSTEDFVSIVYNPPGQVDPIADVVVCNTDPTGAIIFTTSNTLGGTTTYDWTNTNPAIGLVAGGTGNIPSFNAINVTSNPDTAIIEVTPTYSNGTVNCVGTPETFLIIVNPTAQVNQPLDLVLCEGSPGATAFSTINTGGTTSYSWTNSEPGIGLPASGAGDISFTSANATTAPLVATIIVTPTFNNAGKDCTGPTKTYTITVNPEGQVDQPLNVIACNNVLTIVPFTTQNTGGTTSYYWTNDNTSIGLAANGSTDISFTATNPGTTPISATIEVTPTFNNSGLDCSGPSRTFTITVNPTPTLSSTQTPPDICSNSAFSYVPASATAGTAFSWTRADVAGITPAGPTSGVDNPNETLRNLTNLPIGVTYQYTLTANGCSNIQNVIVNVKPEPVIAPGQTTEACSGNALNYAIQLVNFVNPADNVYFTWPAPTLDPVDPDFYGGSARASASMSNISDVYINTTGADGTATYYVTPYKDGCAGETVAIVDTVPSQPVLNASLNTTVCSNDLIGLILSEEAGSVPADYYNITQVILEPGLSADAGNASISFPTAPANYLANDRYLNITGVDKKVTYRVQPVHAPDCFGATVDVEITIRPQPYIVPAQSKVVCSDVPIDMEVLLAPLNTPSGTIYNWGAPTMSDFSGQGSAGVNVAADPAGTLHITDIIHNSSGAPIIATYNITPTSVNGCLGTEIPVIITINPEPTPKPINGRPDICINEVNQVYNVVPAVGSTFHWTVDPVIGTKTFDFNTNSIIIDAAAVPGSGNIIVYETNSYTCDGDISTLPVTVHSQAVPENIIGPVDVCANSTQVYSVTDRPGSFYTWSLPGGSAIIGDPSAASITVVLGNVGGTISVSESNIAGCITDHNPLNVTVRPLPTGIITGGGTICEGATADLNVDFTGTAPFTFVYAINGADQAPITTSDDPYTLTVSNAGTYTITQVSDAGGCSSPGFGASLITYHPKPTGIISGDATICGGETTTLTMTFTGTAPYTFTYTDGTTPLTVPNYPASVYTVDVSPATTSTFILTALTDGNGCDAALSGSAAITVNQPPALSFSQTNLTCNNDNTGAIDLTATGNSPFGFTWTGPLGFTANTEDISGLAAGTYDVSVIDTEGCISSGSVTLTEPGPVDAIVSSTNVFCFGDTGDITISAPSGGSGSYEYSTDGGLTWQLSPSFTGLAPGFYDVRIRDVLSPVCDKILDPALEITGPAELDATVAVNSINCFGANNGSIIITSPIGGFGTYQFTIDGGITWQGSGNFINLGPGTYNVQIRDGAYPGCVVVLDNSALITEPTLISATLTGTNISCFGSSDGTIDITAPAGGSGSYEYSINGGGSWQASGSFAGLAPGLYNVQIRDAAEATCYLVLDAALSITQPASLFATLNSTMISCNGANDGVIEVVGASGGSGSFEYTIDGGLTWLGTALFNGLSPGSYDVRMRDQLSPACELILNNGLDITEPPALSASYVSSDISCFGAADGVITITNPSGGYGTYEYSIDGGISWQSTTNFSGLTASTYDVRIRDAGRPTCFLIIDPAVVIAEPPVLTASVSSTNVDCFNANNGTITISGESGGYGTYEYSINGGASWQPSPNFINLVPNSYDVRVRDASSPACFLIIDPNLVITEPPVLSATVSSTNVSCNGASDGTITVNGASGGYGTYEYTIDGGTSWQLSAAFTGLPAGFYSVRIRDAANPGCTMTINGSLSISEPGPLSANLNSSDVTCNGAADGSITISGATGGYGTFEFTIDGGLSWQSSGSYNNLGPGTYDVRMRDGAQAACELILDAALVITEPPALTGSVSSTDVTCFGSNNGTITIGGAGGGLGTYEYSTNGGSTWSGLSVFNNLAPATYDVRLRDAVNTGCILVLDPALVISEPAVITATVTKTDISCFGASDGEIDITGASGGYGSYEYSITGGGSWQVSGSFTGLGPGNYNVVIRDAAEPGCMVVLNNALQINQPGMLFALVTPTNISCNGANDGIINITAPTGGSGAYEYSIDGGLSWQLSGLFNGLAPATYIVQLRDVASPACVVTLNGALTITEPGPLNANLVSTDITCNGAGDGTISISFASGGYGSYEYSIDGGTSWQASGIYIGLAAGFYNVQLRDGVQTTCVTILDPALEITEPAALSATVTFTDISCNGASNGSISINGAAGGYGSYQYSINGGTSWQSSPTFIGLTAGSYNVVMRDAASTTCQLILDPAITIFEPPALTATFASTNVSCYSASDGTITISGESGGYGSYEYTINGGATWQGSGVFSALGPGFYNIQMRDAANIACLLLLDPLHVISEPGALSAMVSHFDITCNGANDGQISITLPTGGYGTYEYSIDGGLTWQGTGDYTGLTPGTYAVQLRDATQTACFTVLDAGLIIDEPAVLNAVITGTDISCFGANDGIIAISGASGGYGAYQYSIDGGATWYTSGLFTGLLPGSYNVQIRDASNPACIIILDPAFGIIEPAVLTATLNSTDITCYGSSDGTITLSASSGGYGTYEYSINGGGSWQSSGLFNSLAPGTYNVRIRDAANPGCYIVLDPALVVSQPDILNATITATNVTCNGANDGILDITSPTGGSGTYNYSVDGGLTWQATGLFTGLAPGSYNIQILDALSPACIIILNPSLTITEPAVLVANISSNNTSCFGATDGSITISMPSGGYGTYEYSIDGGVSWQASGTFAGLAPASYNVQIRDMAHPLCITVLDPVLAISEPAVLSATIAFTDVTCNGANNGSITISSPAGGYGTYEYSINGGSTWQGSGSFVGLTPASYAVMIRDAAYASCEITLDPALLITEPAVLSASVSSTDITCFAASDGTITISAASGGYGTYDYSVDGGLTWQASGNFTGLPPGYYNVQIRDAAFTSCRIVLDGARQLSQPVELSANLYSTDITCNGGSDGTITISNANGGYGTYEYSIDGSLSWQASGNYTGLSPASYNVMLRDAANITCSKLLNAALVISEPTVLDATISTTMVSCFGGSDGIIDIGSPSGGSGSYQYSIDGGTGWQGSGVFTGLAAATYDVWIRDASAPACMINLNVSLDITEPAVLSATIGSTDVTCYGSSDGTITVSSPLGGYGSYEYSINGGGSWQLSGSFAGLTPGTYNVQIRDAGYTGCYIILDPALTITQPEILEAVVAPTNVSCNGANNGIINITSPLGGSGSYEYSIDGGLTWQLSGLFNLLAPSTYNVQIRDALSTSCVIVLNSSLTISEPLVLNAAVSSTDISCNGANDGSIIITFPSGGYGTYEYSIDGGTAWQSSGTFANLAPGFSNVQIRDAANTGCVIILDAALEISEPVTLSATVGGTNVTCNGANNGTITISSPTGGYGTYEYSVDGGLFWQGSGSFFGLTPGSYNILIRDAANPACVITLDPAYSITEPNALTASVASTDITCFGADDGTITISGESGGYGSYEFSIDGGISWQGSGSFASLTPGFYNIQIRDAANTTCVIVLNSSLRIGEPPPLAAFVTSTGVTCFGGADGSITITSSSGGYGTYDYSIDGGLTWSSTASFTGLAPSTYNVQIRDAAYPLCIAVLDPALIIAEPAILNADISIDNISCFGADNGIITLDNPSGGTGSYQFSIDGGTAWQGSGIFMNLAPGSYDVRIRDAINQACEITLNPSVPVTEPPVLNATVSGTDVSCYGGADGTINITSPSGGYGTFEFSINGGGTWQSSGSFTNLTPGNYVILIRDAANIQCMIVLNNAWIINQPALLSASVAKTDVSCNGLNDGVINITSPTGGYGTYEYSVDGGTTWQASGDFTGLAPGGYDVRIRDMANPACSVTLFSNLAVNEPLVLDVTTTGDILLDCFGDTDGFGTFYATGGTIPYTFTVITNTSGATIDPQGFNTQSFYGAGEGVLTVSVTDANGCTDQSTITLTQPADLTPGAIAGDQVLCQDENPAPLTETVAPTGGPGAITYQWQFSANPGGPFLNISGANAADYTPPPGATETNYYRRMVSSGTCSPVYSNVVEIFVNPKPVAILSGGATICPAETAIIKVDLSSGTGPFELDIANHGIVSAYVSGTDIVVSPAVTTTYSLNRVTDANACEVLAPSVSLMGNATIVVRDIPTITADPVSQVICEFGMTEFEITATGTDLSYQWFVDEGSGFTPITDNGIYVGSASSRLNIFGALRSMDNNRYRVEVSTCSITDISGEALLTVNTNPEIISQPDDFTSCQGNTAGYKIQAIGSGITYQWQVNTGSGFVDVVDDATHSGANLDSLTVFNTTPAMNGWIYRAIVLGICNTDAYSGFAVLNVTPEPLITLQPVANSVCEGLTSTFLVTATGPGISYQWQFNDGSGWADLSDGVIYTGSQTQQLRVDNAPLSASGQLRALVIAECLTLTTNAVNFIVHSNPIIDFSGIDPLLVCGGVDNIINGNPTGGSGVYINHLWTGQVGPLNQFDIQDPIFNTQVTGTFSMNYTVTDNNGCMATDNLNIQVEKPTANFNPAPSSDCPPLDVVFTDASINAVSYSWDFGDGSAIDNTAGTVNHQYINTTNTTFYYNAKLVVESINGCRDSLIKGITVYPQASADFSLLSDTICSGETLMLSSIPGGALYYWDYGDGIAEYGSNVIGHIYLNMTANPVTHTIRLTTTSFYSCDAWIEKQVVVYPQPSAGFLDPPDQVFPDATVNFTNTTLPGNWTYEWNFDDGNSSTSQNPSHTFTAPGDYEVWVKAMNTQCIDSAFNIVSIRPTPPVPGFDSIPGACAPYFVQFNNTSLYADSYIWEFGDGGISYAENPTYEYLVGGIYRVRLTAIGQGGVRYFERLVHVYVKPRAFFEAIPDTVFVDDEDVRCFNLSERGDYYIWEFGDGDTSMVKDPYHKYLREGVFPITLHAYSNNGCYDSYILSPGITVKPAGEIRFANVFRPNKTGPIDSDARNISSMQIDMLFFPPVKEQIENYKLQIFNRSGVLIYQSDDINIGWNGYYKGQLVMQGVYVWYVEGKYSNGKPFRRVGDITLLH